MSDSQLRLLQFLKDRGQRQLAFTASDASEASGLSASSIQTYLSKRLVPNFAVRHDTLRGMFLATSLAESTSDEDFLTFMSQRVRETPAVQQEIHPTYFSRTFLTGVPFRDAINAYFDWIEGSGVHRERRRVRAALGVPDSLQRAAILAGEPPPANSAYRVQARMAGQEAILEFGHRDKANPRSEWLNVARLIQQEDGSLLIEHASGLRSDSGTGPVTTGVPSVLQKLLGLPTVRVMQRDGAVFRPRKVDESALSAYLTYDLLDEARLLPHLVFLTRPDVSATSAPINVEQLAKLLGTQVVVSLVELSEPVLLERAFVARGFSAEMALIGVGGVRLFFPGLSNDLESGTQPRWSPSQINGFGAKATDRLASQVASRVVWRALPERFFKQIEDWDRRDNKSRIASFLQNSGKSEEELALKKDFAELQQVVAQLRDERDLLEAERDALAEKQRATRQEKEDAEALIELAESEIADLIADRDSALANYRNLSATLASLNASKDRVVTLTAKERDSIANALSPSSLSDALTLLETLFYDRVTVLPSAIRSAAESGSFRHHARAWELLRTLATDFLSNFLAGGDDLARRCFGRDSYAAVESESVMARAKAKKLRTFSYQAQDLIMWRHLKIGNKDSVAETWRCHFDVDRSSEKVVIGHCGRHLDHS